MEEKNLLLQKNYEEKKTMLGPDYELVFCSLLFHSPPFYFATMISVIVTTKENFSISSGPCWYRLFFLVCSTTFVQF